MIRSITFTLPGSGKKPAGGYKVVYEYATHLSDRGYQVTVIHPATLYIDRPPQDRLKALRYIPLSLTRGYRPDKWFRIGPRVCLRWVPSLNSRHIPDADVVVATAWQTAEWVATYADRKGRRIYFLHDYEHYMTASEDFKQRIHKSFKRGLQIVCSSPAVRSMVQDAGGYIAAEIPNGLDFSIYYKAHETADAERNMIGFPARSEEFKGTGDAVHALTRVKRSFPKIDVWSFGPKPVRGLPKWVRFYLQPSDHQLRDLYNRTSIFVTASHYEGWGLPGAEAMACGAALVSTDNGGVRAYASDGETALLSPAKEPVALANNIARLIEDQGLRVRIADAGHKHIQQFTWARAVDKFLAVIHEVHVEKACGIR